MRHNAFFASFVLALVFSSACTREALQPPVSPSTLPVVTIGTIIVTPGSTTLGSSVVVSWTSSSAFRVEACNVQCSTIATTGQSVTFTPQSRGTWKFVLYNFVAQPDVSIRAGDTTVFVQ